MNDRRSRASAADRFIRSVFRDPDVSLQQELRDWLVVLVGLVVILLVLTAADLVFG